MEASTDGSRVVEHWRDFTIVAELKGEGVTVRVYESHEMPGPPPQRVYLRDYPRGDGSKLRSTRDLAEAALVLEAQLNARGGSTFTTPMPFAFRYPDSKLVLGGLYRRIFEIVEALFVEASA